MSRSIFLHACLEWVFCTVNATVLDRRLRAQYGHAEDLLDVLSSGSSGVIG
jgi:hypothetical protein